MSKNVWDYLTGWLNIVADLKIIHYCEWIMYIFKCNIAIICTETSCCSSKKLPSKKKTKTSQLTLTQPASVTCVNNAG